MLVQSAGKQCHQNLGSVPLPALSTSASSSQANSPHSPKMTVPDAAYRHNTLKQKRDFLFPQIFFFKSKGKLRTHCHGYWSEYCHVSLLRTVTNQKIGPLFWLNQSLSTSWNSPRNTWRGDTWTQLQFCLLPRRGKWVLLLNVWTMSENVYTKRIHFTNLRNVEPSSVVPSLPKSFHSSQFI